MIRLFITVRSIARRLGLTRIASRLLRTSRYEERFSQSLLAEIRDGDTVWDVGANVGFYTLQFANLVGSSGKVIAFEPNPACKRAIEANAKVFLEERVRIIEVALGNENGRSQFRLGSEELAVDSQILPTTALPDGDTIEVILRRGDTVIQEHGLDVPNILKIDIEGCELECLEGLENTLKSSKLRAAFIEVHFGILEARGMPFAPERIAGILRASGLSQQKWLDASHLVAKRA
jgi:FkbM family methyltransferase